MPGAGNRAGHLFMSFESDLQKAIEVEAEKLISRFHRYHNRLERAHQMEKKRVRDVAPKVIKEPPYWTTDRKFNPFYVSSHSKAIARSMIGKIRNGTYKPFPPVTRSIPKPMGGQRTVTVFQIPDAALSNVLYRELLAKNKHRFSGFSYAYRDDRNAHFAVQDIAVDLRYYSRLFVCEVDFSDFFGSINHEYLYEQFSKNGFFISDTEAKLIRAFLSHQKNGRGLPQGSSISLFLANLACWEMDKALEREGTKFARYADDTIIWTSDYARICKAFEIVNDFASASGISINFKKSDGISLLAQQGLKSEIYRFKHHVDFLGYKIGVDSVGIKEKAILKIKRRISFIIYRNLIQPLVPVKLRAVTIPANGKDEGFLAAVMQVRRYLYGNLSERQLYRYFKGYTRRLQFKGLMSFYPLLDNEKQLKELDGWLLATFDRALKRRAALLAAKNFDRSNEFPFNVHGKELLERCARERIFGKRLLRLPSFLRVYRVIKKGLAAKGIEATMNPRTRRYPSDSR